MDALEPDHVMGMLAAYGCMLEALVKAHPDPLKLMREYLTCVDKTARNLGPLQQQGFLRRGDLHHQSAIRTQEELLRVLKVFREKAAILESWIPG
jgi:hypothetical protein